MREIFVFLILILIFTVPVSADDGNYATQYNNVGAERLYDNLDEHTRDFFDKNNIDVKNPDWVNQLTAKNTVKNIWQLVTSALKFPIKVGILIASVIFLTAAFTAFGVSSRFEVAIYVAVLIISAIIGTNIWQSVEKAVNTIQSCSVFMTAFVPIFATILALSGKTVTAPAMSALLLGGSEAVSFVSSFVVLPIMGGYLSLSMASGVSPLVNNSNLVDGVKKLSIWIMSLAGSVFIGILSIQTAVNSAADGVSLRAAKFILGTSVPVAGGVLSEAVSTISASMGLLRSSIGVYGVVALIVMLFPILIEIILWRCVLMINISLAGLFSLPKVTEVLHAVDSMLSVLLGVVLTVGGMFVISLAIIVTAGKA